MTQSWSWWSSRPWPSTSPTASTTPATRWRRRSPPGRWGRARGRDLGGTQLRRRLPLPGRRGHHRQRPGRHPCGHADRGGGRPDRRHHLEPGHLAVRHSVQFLARAHRRCDRIHDRGVGRQRRHLARPRLQGRHPGGPLADHRRARRRDRHLAGLPDQPVADRGAREPRLRIGQIGSACMVSLAHGTNDAQKTMGVIALALIVNGSIRPGPTRRSGSSSAARSPSPSAPTSAAGGSSARWARASSRSSRRRAWRPSRLGRRHPALLELRLLAVHHPRRDRVDPRHRRRQARRRGALERRGPDGPRLGVHPPVGGAGRRGGGGARARYRRHPRCRRGPDPACRAGRRSSATGPAAARSTHPTSMPSGPAPFPRPKRRSRPPRPET